MSRFNQVSGAGGAMFRGYGSSDMPAPPSEFALGVSGLSGRAGQRWSPVNLGATLLGWWSADRVDLMTLAGSQVSSWRDVVGGYDATQAVSGSRPLYSATGFNGLAGVTFDGNDDELTLASVPFPTGANPCEMWGVVQQDTLPADATNRSFLSYGAAASVSLQVRRSVVSSTNRGQTSTGNGGGQTLGTGTVVDFSSRHVVRSAFGASASTLTIDGVSEGSVSVTPATATTRTRLGAASNTTASGFWKGVIRHLIVTSPLSESQAAQLQAWAMPQRMI